MLSSFYENANLTEIAIDSEPEPSKRMEILPSSEPGSGPSATDTDPLPTAGGDASGKVPLTYSLNDLNTEFEFGVREASESREAMREVR